MPNFKSKYKPKKKGNNERQTWINKLDKVFSLYIRMRDSKEFNFSHFRCISCGRVLPISEADAGHYIGRGHMALRWTPQNVWSECKSCNRFDSSHLIGYRKHLILRLGQEAIQGSAIAQSMPNDQKLRLIKKLGEQRVEALEEMKHEMKKWDVGDLKAMYIHFAEKVLELKKQM